MEPSSRRRKVGVASIDPAFLILETPKRRRSIAVAVSAEEGHKGKFDTCVTTTRKISAPSYIQDEKKAENHDCEDDTDTFSEVSETSKRERRLTHSEIEKRRRNKIKHYIEELRKIVCSTLKCRPSKETVVRMAIQQMRSRTGALHSYTEGHYKPAGLSDQELKEIVLQFVDGFLIVVDCDRGTILYISQSVQPTLGYTQTELLQQNWFEYLHPNDMAHVKDHLKSSHLSHKETLIDSKTLLPVTALFPVSFSGLCPGSRRSFFCSMRHTALDKEMTTKQASSHSDEKKYLLLHFTGYLKSRPNETDAHERYSPGGSCLVAVGRALPNVLDEQVEGFSSKQFVTPMEFTSRHSTEGKFLYVDHRVCLMLDYLPNELVGNSLYEYYHPADLTLITNVHRSLLSNDLPASEKHRFRKKCGSYVWVQTKWKVFRNPFTKEIEFLVATHQLMKPKSNGMTGNQDCEVGAKQHSSLEINNEPVIFSYEGETDPMHILDKTPSEEIVDDATFQTMLDILESDGGNGDLADLSSVG